LMRQEEIEKLAETINQWHSATGLTLGLAEYLYNAGYVQLVPDAERTEMAVKDILLKYSGTGSHGTCLWYPEWDNVIKEISSILHLTQPTLPEITDIGGRDIPKIVKDLEAAKLSSLFSYRQAYLVGANAMRDLCIETLQKQTLAMMRNPEKAKARDILRMSRR